MDQGYGCLPAREEELVSTNPDCTHPRVTTYSRMIFAGDLIDPPEHVWKTVCDECGEELGEVPDGSTEKLEEWEDDYEE